MGWGARFLSAVMGCGGNVSERLNAGELKVVGIDVPASFTDQRVSWKNLDAIGPAR
jgi:hypothetical protein